MRNTRHIASMAALVAALAGGFASPVAARAVHHGKARHAFSLGADARPVVTRVRAGVAQLPAGSERPGLDVFLSLGQGELINLPASAANVWTSNPNVADVYVSNPRQINVYGKGNGDGTIFATAAGGQVVYAANIHVSQNVSSVDQTLKAALPGSNITVNFVGQTAVLNGTVASPNDSADAENMVKSLLNPGIKLDGNEPLKIGVINRLRTATPLQVYLKVRIAEVSRTLSHLLQSNLATMNGQNGFQYAVGLGRGAVTSTQVQNSALGVGINPSTYQIDPTTLDLANPANIYDTAKLVKTPATGIGALANAATIAAQGHFLGLDFVEALDAGEQAGLVTTLAEPNLTAMSGETAEFLAGGEFPIPISQGLGAVSIDFKKFGVSLSYTPTVLANGNISIRVAPEVSELSSQGAITLNGFTIPALTVRRAETSVELGSGQSFMIAGLMSNNASHTINKLPGAGDVPIIGALFKSTSFQKGETELVIVITPYLVKPVNSDTDIKLPTDGYKSANAIEQALGGMMTEAQTGQQAERPHPTAADAPDGKPASADKGASADGKTKHTANSDAATPGFTLN